MTDAGRDYILGKLDRLSGPRKQRLRYGKWVAAEGQIYEEWDEAHHLVDRFKIPRSWPRFWSIDFGYRNPFVCQRWAQDPDGRLYLYAETYMTGRLVEDHARNILREVTRMTGDPEPGDAEDPLKAVQAGRRVWREPMPDAVICDHDAEGRATWEKHSGLTTVAANKDVLTGIELVQARIRRDATGKAGLFILRDSVTERDQKLIDAAKPASTAEEVPGYVWKRKPSTVLAGERPEPEEPVKVDDHGCDGKRYLVAHIDGGAQVEFRALTW
jgi:phage terminase large subunit